MRIFQIYFNALLQPMRHVTAWYVLCLLLAAGTARAAVFTVDGITYQTLTTSTVQVGDGTNKAISTSKTECVIPATVSNGGTSYTVTSIGDDAFYNCPGLTSVTLPEPLTSIGVGAFMWCSSLTSVTVPAHVTSIGNSAFYNCSGLTSVTLPTSLTSIGSYAFSGCSGLTSVTLPASLTTIEYEVFYNCSQLVSIYYLGVKEPAIFDGAFIAGPSVRILYVPNATGGFTASKWGAVSVVYGADGGAGNGEEVE